MINNNKSTNMYNKVRNLLVIINKKKKILAGNTTPMNTFYLKTRK